MKSPAFIAVLLAMLAACQDTGPTIPDTTPRFTANGEILAQDVTGGGTFVREDVAGLPRGSYAFHARVDATDRVTGEAELHFATTDARVHIDIQCLRIAGNEAWLSGPVTRSNYAALPPGKVMLWQVQDNGDGGAAQPDRVSGFAYKTDGNYAPDVCKWKYPMALLPWENGNVRILTPGSIGLWDLVGTWDVTYFICVNLANPADTQSIASSGVRMRQTVAPDGRYTMIYWVTGTPDRIIENTRGTLDVVNGVVQVHGDEDPSIITASSLRTGNTWRIEFDGNVCHWDADDQEDPSHVVAESRLKTSGPLVNDFAGVWDASMFRFTSVADPDVVVDLVPQGTPVTLTVGLDSHYTLQIGTGPGGNDAGEILFEGNEMLVRGVSPAGPWQDSHAMTFELRRNVWSYSGLAEWDFDGDPATPREPAVLDAVLVRR